MPFHRGDLPLQNEDGTYIATAWEHLLAAMDRWLLHGSEYDRMRIALDTYDALAVPELMGDVAEYLEHCYSAERLRVTLERVAVHVSALANLQVGQAALLQQRPYWERCASPLIALVVLKEPKLLLDLHGRVARFSFVRAEDFKLQSPDARTALAGREGWRVPPVSHGTRARSWKNGDCHQALPSRKLTQKERAVLCEPYEEFTQHMAALVRDLHSREAWDGRTRSHRAVLSLLRYLAHLTAESADEVCLTNMQTLVKESLHAAADDAQALAKNSVRTCHAFATEYYLHLYELSGA